MAEDVKTKKMSISTTKDMTKGDPKKNILSFALPILLSQIFQQLYNSVDSLIVGNYLGKNALAAVSSSGPLIFLLISFFEGAAMGAGVVIARYFGAGDQEKVSKTIHTNVIFGLLCGIALSIAGVALTPTLLRWMQTNEAVIDQSIAYFRYYFIGAISVVMYNIFTGIMRAVGDSKRPLIYLIISSILNIILDLVFVAGFGLGVEYAAIATTIAQTISAVLCLIQLRKKGTVYRISFHLLKMDKDILLEIIRFGLPTGIQNSVIGFANVIVQSRINTFGADAMAGYGAWSKIEGFGFLPINCIVMSLSTFVGQNLGAKEYERAKKGARFGLILSPLLAETIGLIIFFTAPYLVSAFNSDPGVVAYGTQQARIVSLFFFLLSFSHCVAAILRGAGRAVVPMSIMLLCWCVIRIIYIILVTRYIGDIKFVYWAYPITWALSSIIYLIYYLKSDWIHGFEKKSPLVKFFDKILPSPKKTSVEENKFQVEDKKEELTSNDNSIMAREYLAGDNNSTEDGIKGNVTEQITEKKQDALTTRDEVANITKREENSNTKSITANITTNSNNDITDGNDITIVDGDIV